MPDEKQLPHRVTEEVSKEASGRDLVLNFDHVYKFRPGDTTPTVKNLTRFRTRGESITITDFDDGQQAQVIYILGDGTTTIDHNANINRNSGAAGVLDNNLVYVFMYVDGIWHELACCSAEGEPVELHAETHEDGGTDEINVEGLSGLLVDPQVPVDHAGSHENGGGDEINVEGLSGVLAEPQLVEVAAEGVLVGTRDRINLIAGPNTIITVTDDGGGSKVDIEIESTGGGGGSSTHVWMPLTTVVGGVPELVWDADNSLIPTLVPI